MTVHASIMEALEGEVSATEAVGSSTGQWRTYDVAYAAYSAFHHGQNPIEAAWSALAEAPREVPWLIRLSMRGMAEGIERKVTAILDAARAA